MRDDRNAESKRRRNQLQEEIDFTTRQKAVWVAIDVELQHVGGMLIIGPNPTINFRYINTMLVGILLALNLAIPEHLFGVCPSHF